MFFRYKSNIKTVDPMSEVSLTVEPLLKPSSFLRYDRSHKAASAGEQVQRSAMEPTVTGEADMEVTGPGAAGGGDPARSADHRPTNSRTSATSGRQPAAEVLATAGGSRREEHEDPDSRAARLARIQAEIADGTYETEEKLETAVERLLREIR